MSFSRFLTQQGSSIKKQKKYWNHSGGAIPEPDEFYGAEPDEFYGAEPDEFYGAEPDEFYGAEPIDFSVPNTDLKYKWFPMKYKWFPKTLLNTSITDFSILIGSSDVYNKLTRLFSSMVLTNIRGTDLLVERDPNFKCSSFFSMWFEAPMKNLFPESKVNDLKTRLSTCYTQEELNGISEKLAIGDFDSHIDQIENIVVPKIYQLIQNYEGIGSEIISTPEGFSSMFNKDIIYLFLHYLHELTSKNGTIISNDPNDPNMIIDMVAKLIFIANPNFIYYVYNQLVPEPFDIESYNPEIENEFEPEPIINYYEPEYEPEPKTPNLLLLPEIGENIVVLNDDVDSTESFKKTLELGRSEDVLGKLWMVGNLLSISLLPNDFIGGINSLNIIPKSNSKTPSNFLMFKDPVSKKIKTFTIQTDSSEQLLGQLQSNNTAESPTFFMVSFTQRLRIPKRYPPPSSIKDINMMALKTSNSFYSSLFNYSKEAKIGDEGKDEIVRGEDEMLRRAALPKLNTEVLTNKGDVKTNDEGDAKTNDEEVTEPSDEGLGAGYIVLIVIGVILLLGVIVWFGIPLLERFKKPKPMATIFNKSSGTLLQVPINDPRVKSSLST